MNCSIDGCTRKYFGRGLCSAHYRRLRRHGSPAGGGISRGSVQLFLEHLLSHDQGDECVKWPFGGEAYGYGRVRLNGRTVRAHCVVAERKYGPKPTPKHEACHSCGKGHEGCVNPRHIYWGTRSDNMQDAVAHGTAHCLKPEFWQAGQAAQRSFA